MDVKVGQSTVLLILAALGHVVIVLIFLLFVFLTDVFLCGICHSCNL